MLEVVILADDLTGAADCGIAFAAAGLETFVAFGDGPPPAQAEVVSVDTDSRREVEAEAARRARAATERARAAGARALYRKIDSTLRGHVGPELAATLATLAAPAAPRPVAILAPAFPATGRTTVGGEVLVSGVLLERTETWRDARMSVPARPSELLRQAGLRPHVVPLAQVRAGTGPLATELERRAATAADVLVCDAESEEDLAAVARAGARLVRPVVWAGSAGLARHLPGALGLARERRGVAPAPGPRAAGPVVVVVGSRSSVAREQARLLAAEPEVRLLSVDPRVLLAGEGDPRWPAAEVDRAIASGADLLVAVGDEPLGPERGPRIAAAAARLVGRHAGRISGLVATGGDVARALLASIGATGIHLAGEVEPGVPLGIADVAPPLAVVTKAGAFGDARTLSRCRAALRARVPAA